MIGKGLTSKRKDKPIGKGDLLCILNNRFYSGSFEWNDENGERKIYKGTNYEPLISEDLYNKVKTELNKKAIKYSTRHSSAKFFKYRGLLKCEFCGCVMTPSDMSSNYKNKKPGEEVYYRCSYSKKNVNPLWYKYKFGEDHSGVRIWKGKKHYNCPQMLWKEEEIDFLIMEYLSTLTYDKRVYKNIKKKLGQAWEDRVTINEAQKKGLEAELAEKQRLKKGLIRGKAMKAEFDEDFDEVLRDVKAEIEKIEQELRSLDELENIDTEQVTEMLDLCQNLHEQYSKLSDMDKRRLVMLAFKEIKLKRGRIKKQNFSKAHFEYTEPFQELYEGWLKKYVKSDESKDLIKIKELV